MFNPKTAKEEKSLIRDMIEDAISDGGGYQNDVFHRKDLQQRLSGVHNKVSQTVLDLDRVRKLVQKVKKIEDLIVNENSGVRELNIAVLMTHWDHIAPVYFLRGNALMASKRWFNAIEDFKMSLHHGYTEQVFKVHHKIGQCFVKRKQYAAATESFKTALDNLKASKDENEKTKTTFTSILTECIKKFSSKKDEPLAKSTEIRVTKPSSVDPRITGMVEVLEEVGKGRTALAKTSIPVGSVLVSDEGAGPHLNPDNSAKNLQYCLHCLRNAAVPYPCPTCPRVVFCSQQCQTDAKDYHKYQCALQLQGLRSKDTSDGYSIFAPLRMLLCRPASWWVEHGDQLLQSQEADWPAPNTTEQQKVSNLLSMETNEQQLSPESLARHVTVVVLLLRALRNYTQYYVDSGLSVGEGPLSREELMVGRVLYRLRLITDMNTHPLWGAEWVKGTEVDTEIVGGGLYSGIGSYFNSACNPNTFRINVGGRMLLIAAENIKRGEEVTDNYCAHFSELSCVQRQHFLEENYKFLCECTACEEGWEGYRTLPDTRPNQKVGDKLVELEMDNLTAMECGNHDRALLTHCKEVSLIQNNMSQPHQLMVTIRHTFIKAWWRKVLAIINENTVGECKKEAPMEHYFCN